MGAPVSVPVDSLLPTRSAADLVFLDQKAWAYVVPGENLYVLYALASAGTAGPPDPTGALIYHADLDRWTSTTRHPLSAAIVDPATGYTWAAESGSNWTRRDLRVGTVGGWAAEDFHDGTGTGTIGTVNATTGAVFFSSPPLVNGVRARVGDVLVKGAVKTRITSADSGDGNVVVADATGLTTGSATLYRGYSAVIEYAPYHPKPIGQHFFTETALEFGEAGFRDPNGALTQDGTSIRYGPGATTWASEGADFGLETGYVQGNAPFGTVSAASPYKERGAVPPGQQRSRWLGVRFTNTIGLARWSFTGLTVESRYVSGKSP
jgi:hypothetical protein